MQRSLGQKASVVLVVIATLLSALDGVLSLLSTLVFSNHESGRLWASIIVPAFLWVTALICLKFPRGGVVSFLLLFGMSVTLCADPFRHLGVESVRWTHCTLNLGFALLGGVLLLVNAFLPRLKRALSKESD